MGAERNIVVKPGKGIKCFQEVKIPVLLQHVVEHSIQMNSSVQIVQDDVAKNKGIGLNQL
jgi:hypothetical protein